MQQYDTRSYEQLFESEKIIILDGATGSLMKSHGLNQIDSAPIHNAELTAFLHRLYIDAGADIIETCSVCAQSVTLPENLRDAAYDINFQAARIARSQADGAMMQPFGGVSPHSHTRHITVAGAIGPTDKSITRQSIDYSTLRGSYALQIEALTAGGVDCLLIETVTDISNAIAAIDAAEMVFAQCGKRLPIAVSLYITPDGKTLCSHTLAEAAQRLDTHRLAAFGINCSSCQTIEKYAAQLIGAAQCPTMVYPSVQSSNGSHTDTSPEEFAQVLQRCVAAHNIRIVGGCCGTTPKHIKYLAEKVGQAE